MTIHQTQTVSFPDKLPRVFTSSVVVGSNRDDIFPGKFPCQFLDLSLFRCQLCVQRVVLESWEQFEIIPILWITKTITRTSSTCMFFKLWSWSGRCSRISSWGQASLDDIHWASSSRILEQLNWEMFHFLKGTRLRQLSWKWRRKGKWVEVEVGLFPLFSSNLYQDKGNLDYHTWIKEVMAKFVLLSLKDSWWVVTEVYFRPSTAS